jgi:nucleotide-binding universal stress UspA family protein
MSRIKKILAPTDFSELSKLGIGYALELARDTGAEVMIYHAIDLGDMWEKRRTDLGAYQNMLEHSRQTLDNFLAENFADRIDLVEVRQSVEVGGPVNNIVEKAAKESIDLIVMSTHGRTGIEHMILGSVTEKIVARASCPVLVVPRRRAVVENVKAA